MCILCYGLAGEEHWSQALGEEGAGARRRRREVAAAVLAPYGLALKGDVGGLADVVGDRKGRSEVVRGLGELWPAAQRLSAAPLDPLDPALLDRLAAGGDRR
jgi:hypothetical protein